MKYLSMAEMDGIRLSRESINAEYARGEMAADMLGELLGKYNTLRKIGRSNKGLLLRAQELVGTLRENLGILGGGKKKAASVEAEAARLYEDAAGNLEKLIRKAAENSRYVGAMGDDKNGRRRYVISAENKNITQDISSSMGENPTSTFLRNASMGSVAQNGEVVNTEGRNHERNYSLSEEGREEAQKNITAKYQQTVDRILNGRYYDQNAVLMGYTPDLLRRLGVPDLPVVIGPGHIYSIAKTEAEARRARHFSRNANYHGLGEAAVKTLYEKLGDPIAVIASRDTDTGKFPVRSQRSIVEIIDIGTDGKSLLAAVEVTAARRVDGVEIDVNVLSSAYERNITGLLREAIAQENAGEIGVFYINNEAADLVVDARTIRGGSSQASASGIIVHQIPEKVNLKVENQTQTRQFAEWFGEWQNDPSRASQVVNEDGTPKVMYHETLEKGLYEFNKDFIGSRFGADDVGFFFTDSRSLAEDYSTSEFDNSRVGEVIPVYLNIRKEKMQVPREPGTC